MHTRAHPHPSQGVHNDLALRHVPEMPPRNDTLAGPVGRRGDVVGAPYFMSMEDARKVAPLWYDYTVRVRNDTEVGRRVCVCVVFVLCVFVCVRVRACVRVCVCLRVRARACPQRSLQLQSHFRTCASAPASFTRLVAEQARRSSCLLYTSRRG
mgnify:CR=1 FL=1